MSKEVKQVNVSAKLPPRRPKNLDVRSREHLTSEEVEKLRKGARSVGRHRVRDDLIIFLMFRHAFRVKEISNLKWDQVDFDEGAIYVNRNKGGCAATHPLSGSEMRALRKLKRIYTENPHVFISEYCSPLTTRSIHNIIARAGKMAGFSFSIHPHMLRHSTGYYLANKGEDTRAIQAYLGHVNIHSTVRYTALAPNRFKNFWNG